MWYRIETKNKIKIQELILFFVLYSIKLNFLLFLSYNLNWPIQLSRNCRTYQDSIKKEILKYLCSMYRLFSKQVFIWFIESCMIKLVQLIMLKCLQIINWHSKDVITKDWLIILNRSTDLSFGRERLLAVKKNVWEMF